MSVQSGAKGSVHKMQVLRIQAIMCTDKGIGSHLQEGMTVILRMIIVLSLISSQVKQHWLGSGNY